jgi:hypothetical protein
VRALGGAIYTDEKTKIQSTSLKNGNKNINILWLHVATLFVASTKVTLLSLLRAMLLMSILLLRFLN